MTISMENISGEAFTLINHDLKGKTLELSKKKLEKIRRRLQKIYKESTKYETDT